MKKKIILTLGALFIGAMAITLNSLSERNFFKSLTNSDVEALAACEITGRKGKVLYKCTGERNTCSVPYGGYTLSCSGTKE